MPKKKTKLVRPLAPVLHIYCEGEKTEPNYLNNYIQTFFPGERRKDVIKVEHTKKNTPVQLVDEAIRHKRRADCPDGDVFWVVYDRESVAKYPDKLHSQAFLKAKISGINIALSNVCFELWLLLHLVPCGAAYVDYSDLMANSNFKKEFEKIGIKNYDKGSNEVFSLLKDNVCAAKSRAESMNGSTIANSPPAKNEPYQLNPYTDMHLLIDAINIFP